MANSKYPDVSSSKWSKRETEFPEYNLPVYRGEDTSIPPLDISPEDPDVKEAVALLKAMRARKMRTSATRDEMMLEE